MTKMLRLMIAFAFAAISLCNVTLFDNSTDEFESIEPEEEEERDCSGKGAIKTEVLTLLRHIAETYLRECINVVLYDENYEKRGDKMNFDLDAMLKDFPGSYVNGQIAEAKRINRSMLRPVGNECRNFVLLLADVSWTVTLLGPLRFGKVVVLTVSSRWKIEEYLEGWQARDIVNLLVVSYNWKESVLFSVEEADEKIKDINLYTHNLYTDGLGSSSYRLLTSWRCGKLARNVDLFPKKMTKGFNGRQFLVAASEQPPFTFKKRRSVADESNESHLWDGVEIRLLRLLATFLNYTIEIVEPKAHITDVIGPSERVIAEVVRGEAEIGSAGIYVTNDRIRQINPSLPHSTDCAAFITKASTAIPGQRAILGPFQWTVWLALTLTYLSAIIPITFADSLSLKPLWKNPWLLENMFWQVFGTFTNCFTFSDKNSWSKTQKTASRLFIGWYWAFTIIVTACYTGSIVSFITLFVFPDAMDTVDQMAKKNFRVGTLSTGGWSRWFNESDDPKTKWLLRDVELVPNTTQGLKNVSRSFYLPMFRPYAFLAGRAQMEYIVKANYTMKTKRKETLHITKECFVPFGVSYAFPTTAVYADLFNEYILRVQQSGLMAKLLNEFQWEVERSASGKLLQAGSGKSLREFTPLQRKLTLDDTQGMYLLMAAGYLLGLVALIWECIHFAVKNRKSVSIKERLSFVLFWRSRCFRALLLCLSSLPRTLIAAFCRSEPESRPNHSSLEKRDVQILTIRSANARGESDAEHLSELNLNRWEYPGPFESRSLPVDIDEESLEDNFADDGTRRRDNADTLFGSINSVPWNVNNVLHRRNSRTLERVQSY